VASPRTRLDRELVRRRLAESRTEAQRLIAAGRVTVGGAPALKAASMVTASDDIVVGRAAAEYASRGGHKLAGALDALGVGPQGRIALDAGASTGGFTDVLLQRGARRVMAVDVGYGQLAWHLRTDERVVVLDRTNVRNLQPADLPEPPDLVVADLSFISLTLVLPALATVATAAADHVLLVKPQFEAGPGGVGKGGVVRDPAVWQTALRRVIGAAADLGLGLVGVTVSPLPGPSGNVEHFVHLRRGAAGDASEAIAAAVAAGVRLAAAPDR
jgi:23S rRNA (cytidine1920-2'-O)/16S rRNA (cytidine1409-2'-O)-methyltransferase